MYGNKTLPERLDIIGPKGQTIPNAKINLEYFISKDEFKKMLYDDKLKYAEIIEKIGFPYDSSNFSRMVRKIGWKTELGRVDKFTVNERFFDEWSRESAWVYGWLITDGYANKKSIDLTLQKSDSDVLDKFKTIVEFTGIKYIRENKETLRIYNPKLVQSLHRLGFPKENKTFTCEMPNIPKDYLWDFIRGAFEGDGSISSSKGGLNVSICGASEKLMMGINDFLNSFGIQTGIYRGKEDFFVVRASGIANALRWLYFMYANTHEGIRMNRKFNKYVDFVNSFYDKPRKVKGAVELVELARQTIPQCAEIADERLAI